MVEGHDWPALACSDTLVRPNADPIHLAVQLVPPRFGALATDSNDRVEAPSPNPTHAVVYSELTGLVTIAVMSPFIDERAYGAHAVMNGKKIGSNDGPDLSVR